MIRMPKSLSVRLLLVFIASALVILVVLSTLFSYGVSREWRQQIRPHLAQYVSYVRSDLGDPPSIERADALAATLPVDIHIFKGNEKIHSTNGRRFNPDRYRFRQRASSRGAKESRSSNENNHSRRHNILNRVQSDLEFARSRHHSVVKIPMKQHIAYIELDRNIGARNSRRAHLFLLPVVLVSLLAALYFMLRRLLSPIADIKNGVAAMTKGNLNHQIPVKREDDLGQLASSVNGFSTRIQSLLDAKRQLLLSVSHELRSPLTRAQLAANMMPASKHQEHVLEELKLLDSLIESLIESERLQSEHAVLNISSIELQSIVVACVNDIENELGDEIDKITLGVPEESLVIQGDEVRIRLLCRNLLNNAVQHGKTYHDGITDSFVGKASISVSLKALNSMAILSITDSGDGVDESDLVNLTDAFYRPDPSRAHGKGGVGLGLSLAKLIAEAHGGIIKLSHRTDKLSGLVATVELPLEHTTR